MESTEIQRRVGENLKRIRKSRKLTQMELAIRADVSEETIKNVELSRAWPSDKTLSQITNALEIDVYNLFLPVEKSLQTTNDIHEKLKCTIASDLLDYVDSVLKTVTANE